MSAIHLALHKAIAPIARHAIIAVTGLSFILKVCELPFVEHPRWLAMLMETCQLTAAACYTYYDPDMLSAAGKINASYMVCLAAPVSYMYYSYCLKCENPVAAGGVSLGHWASGILSDPATDPSEVLDKVPEALGRLAFLVLWTVGMTSYLPIMNPEQHPWHMCALYGLTGPIFCIWLVVRFASITFFFPSIWLVCSVALIMFLVSGANALLVKELFEGERKAAAQEQEHFCGLLEHIQPFIEANLTKVRNLRQIMFNNNTTKAQWHSSINDVLSLNEQIVAGISEHRMLLDRESVTQVAISTNEITNFACPIFGHEGHEISEGLRPHFVVLVSASVLCAFVFPGVYLLCEASPTVPEFPLQIVLQTSGTLVMAAGCAMIWIPLFTLKIVKTVAPPLSIILPWLTVPLQLSGVLEYRSHCALFWYWSIILTVLLPFNQLATGLNFRQVLKMNHALVMCNFILLCRVMPSPIPHPLTLIGVALTLIGVLTCTNMQTYCILYASRLCTLFESVRRQRQRDAFMYTIHDLNVRKCLPLLHYP
jgi:hypothetical protein